MLEEYEKEQKRLSRLRKMSAGKLQVEDDIGEFCNVSPVSHFF